MSERDDILEHERMPYIALSHDHCQIEESVITNFIHVWFEYPERIQITRITFQ